MKRHALLCLCATVSLLYTALADTPPPSSGGPFKDLLLRGEVTADGGGLVVKSKAAAFVLGDRNAAVYRVTAEVTLAPKGAPLLVTLLPTDPADLKKAGLGQVSIVRDPVGRALTLHTATYGEGKQWVGARDALTYRYWPAETDKAGLKLMANSALEPRSWHGRRLRLRIDAELRSVSVWLEGLLVRRFDRPEGAQGPVAIQLAEGDRLGRAALEATTPNPLYLPLDITAQANDRFEKPVGQAALKVGTVPFELPQGGADHINVQKAGWPEVKQDPASYYEHYDGGPYVLHDPRMPLLRVPVADYVAAHVLAVADADAQLTPAFTLQAGRYGYAGQVVQYDFFSPVPRRGQDKDLGAARAVTTPGGTLYHVRVPLDTAFAQDLERFIEITLTKEIRLARRQPDPNRFRYRPLGLPSGVRIAALTLERSPLQLHVGSKESGHAFVEPQTPEFQVRLTNVTSAVQPFTVRLQATHLDGTKTGVQRAGKVAANQTEELTLAVPTKKRGYHDLVVMLSDGRKQVLLNRRTSFALLPADTRRHRATSPFGTWDFSGGHFTSNQADVVGPLYVKMGLRFGMFGFTPEERKKYGVVNGAEPVISNGGAGAYEKYMARAPDTPPVGLIFHEHGISGRHLTRVPDLFHDRPAYKLNDVEEKQFQKLWEQAVSGAREMRAKYPKVHLRLGNGALPTREELYRRKFPAELFDSAGNETGAFGRMPEAQPPDCIANNASLWMDRQMLDAYGYKDKPVTQCYEVCYPSTNPGNLTPRTQADYFVRHALHALAWGVPEFRAGSISDMGNSYYYSNWGSCGFCCRKPELNVKPSFVAFATLTRVLDGAKFVRVVPTDSASVYIMEFNRPDGTQAHVLWTLRGRRPVKLTFDAAGPWQRIDDQGNEVNLPAKAGAVEVTLTPSPVYVVGKGHVRAAEPGKPVYDDRPDGKSTILTTLSDLEDWSVVAERSPELEFYDFMTPRRQGDFAFEPVTAFEGRERVLRVTPRPIKHGKDTMPMYAVLAHKKGIAVPGTPTEIGVWVNGNSGWGRVLFELTDATGQRWVSLGATQGGETSRWLEDAVPKELLEKFPTPGISDWNTEDVFGTSRINFDGWRYVAFPLPGNYPGENYPWPANSQWRWDKDGIVHYPLTLRNVTVELPEKMLHVKRWAPVARPAIYLHELIVGEGDTVRRKTTAQE